METEGFSVSPENESAAEQFLRIVNNRGKFTKGGEDDVRTKGFVVLVHHAKSLAELQKVCVQHQSYNQCLTARYRIQSKPIFGTLLAAFVSNMLELLNQEGGYSDHFLPDLDDPAWRELQEKAFDQRMGNLSLPGEGKGELNEEWLRQFKQTLSDQEFFSTGKRLILFAEVVDPENSIDEWRLAFRTLFRELPERFGLVLTGAPAEFHLIDGPDIDPHFLEIDWQDQEVAGEQAAAYLVSSLQNDQPAEKDQLGVENFAIGIARLILHKGTSPLTIGIQAPWGKGKSSFMRFIDNALIRWAPANRKSFSTELEGIEKRLNENKQQLKEALESDGSDEKTERIDRITAARGQIEGDYRKLWQRLKLNALNDVLTISFNSWQYEDSTQIWAGLASRVSREIERVMPMMRQVKTRMAYAWQDRKMEVLVRLVLPILVAVLLSAGILIAYRPEFSALLNQFVADEKIPDFLDFAGIFVPVGSGLFLFWFIMWRTLTVLNPISHRMLEYVQMPSYRDQMGYQHRVMSDLRFMQGQLRNWKRNVRMVVFIDDLDRCSENKIMEVLQAIHLILGASDFFVLLGIDTEMLYRAIRSYYGKQSGERSLPPNFPETYLRKIIQLPFHLPEFSENERFALVHDLFSVDAQIQFNRLVEHKKINDQIAASPPEEEPAEPLPYDMAQLRELRVQELEAAEDTAAELMAYKDFGRFLEDNPRELKRLVNVHRLVKILIQLNRPSMVWSQSMQRKLVKWLIFCARWPELIDDVLRQARGQKGKVDCLDLTADDLKKEGDGRGEHLKLFAGWARADDVITAEELESDGDFYLAAYLSHLIREERINRGRGAYPKKVDTKTQRIGGVRDGENERT